MIRRSAKYAMLGGVCAGYAISEKKPIALVRTFAALLLMFTGGAAALFYLIAWIVMPSGEGGPQGWEQLSAEEKLVRSPTNKVIGGVCAAFAKYFGLDATLVRAITLCLFLLAGTGLLAYLFAWAIIPEKGAELGTV